jgi:hypothetical protein
MKRLAIVFAIIVILVVSGGLTAQIASNGNQLNIPGIVRQTTDPNASALDMAPWKAEQMFLFVGFILFNLVGIAVTIMAILWFLNWQIKKVKSEGTQTVTSGVSHGLEEKA